MRKVSVLLGVLAIAASAATATAASLYNIPPLAGHTSSEGRAITPDGKYVGVDSGGGTRGAVWDVTNGTREITSGGLNTLSGATGIGYRTVEANQQLLAYAAWDGSTKDAPTTFISTDGGATWSTVTCATGATPLVMRVANTLVGSMSDVWYAHYQDKNDYGNAVKGSGNPPSANYSKYKPTRYSNMEWNGCGGAGIIAGSRPIGGTRQNAWYTGGAYAGGADATETFFSGLDGTLVGEAWSVSLDGSLIGGRSPVSDGRTGDYPYVYDLGGGESWTIAELPIDPAAENYTNNAVVYGMGPNNDWACGMMYPGMEKAVLWDISDPDPANWTYIDLTQWADDHGILGNFTGNLRRAYSVGVNDLGQPVVTGWGYDEVNAQVRGFVLTIPEPGTLSFLALGGLVLLRRRR